jgi:hypothetical protein
MNLQENIHRIKQVMGINEQSDIISRYVSDPRLIGILKGIETSLGEKFTDQHFKTEIQYSGGLKQEAGGLLPEVINAFNKMKNESGCSDIFIKENAISYRSYDDQKNQFIQEASKYQQDKINNALKRVAIPGFSQHHTGKSIDYGGNTICLRKNAWPSGNYGTANKWGFTLPYMAAGIKRMEEPWHLFYVGASNVPQNKTNPPQNQTGDVIQITEADFNKFAERIASETSSKSLDLSSIALDVDKRTFSVSPGNTPVLKVVLRWNLPNEPKCISCENTISKNPEYKPQVLKNVKWENGTRIANLIVLYPKAQ